MNMRTRDPNRQFSYSNDDGKTWSKPAVWTPLPGQGYAGGTCEGSTVSIPDGSTRLLFSTPFSSKGRENMTVFMSKDFGKNWDVYRHIDPGPSA